MKQTNTRHRLTPAERRRINARRTLRKLTAAALEGFALLAMIAATFAVCVLILETI